MSVIPVGLQLVGKFCEQIHVSWEKQHVENMMIDTSIMSKTNSYIRFALQYLHVWTSSCLWICHIIYASCGIQAKVPRHTFDSL